MGRTFKDTLNALKYLANMLGAHSIGQLLIDEVNEDNMDIPEKMLKKAALLGRKLAR
jgi:hypothetical protein